MPVATVIRSPEIKRARRAPPPGHTVYRPPQAGAARGQRGIIPIVSNPEDQGGDRFAGQSGPQRRNRRSGRSVMTTVGRSLRDAEASNLVRRATKGGYATGR